MDVLDRAKVKLSFVGPMLWDAREPVPLRSVRSEFLFDVIVVHGRACSTVQATFLRKHGPEPLLGAQPPHAPSPLGPPRAVH